MLTVGCDISCMSAKPMRLGENTRAKLIASEQTLSEVLQAARACLFETGPDLRVIEMGGQSGWIDGDAVQLIGEKIDELVADRDDPEVRNILADIGAHKPFRDLTLQAPSPQGLRFVRASGKPRFGARQFVGYRGIAVDMPGQRFESVTLQPGRNLFHVHVPALGSARRVKT